MKKSLITAAVLLGISTIAMADDKHPMSINADGLGQVLLYPYYTVKDGFDTAFTLINTTDTYRAVKVRIIEGKNSWEVLDFNLYMSPNDTWQGMLHAAGDHIKMLTADRSCTRPRFPSNLTQEEIDDGAKAPDPYLRDINLKKVEGVQDVIRRDKKIPSLMYALRPDQNKGDNPGYNEYSPENILKRMSEGYIEVIDMGAIVTEKKIDEILGIGDSGKTALGHIFKTAEANLSGEPLRDLKKQQKALAAAIKHNGDGIADCKSLVAYAHDHWGDNPDYGIYLDGENALTGTATIINVSNGVAGSYNAVAIKNFVEHDILYDEATPADSSVKLTATRTVGSYTLHNEPGSSYPNLNGQVQRKDSEGDAQPYYARTNKDALVQKNGSGVYAIFDTSNLLYKSENGKTYKDLTGPNGTGGSITPNAISLTAILMAREVIGEYYLEDATRSASDMVITMPTKHYFTNGNTSNLKGVSQGYGSFGFIKDIDTDEDRDLAIISRDLKAYKPYTHTAFDRRSPLYEPAVITYFDRDERGMAVTAADDFSPSDVPNSVGINAEANVLQFAGDKAHRVFDSINAHNVAPKYKSGWVHVAFEDQFVSDDNTAATAPATGLKISKAKDCTKDNIATGRACLRGLPVIGISATKYVNSILYMQSIGGDVLSNYLGIVDTAYHRDNIIK